MWKKAETARGLQTNHWHTSKAKARRSHGGVRVRVRARSCCVSVKWSLSDATCLVVCHCCGCLGGCRWSCCRFVILPLIVSRVPIKKSSLVYIVDVTPDWFTTSLSWSSCMCVSVGACVRLRFLIIILLFYSIDACLYFQFVFHFVVGKLHRLTHRLVHFLWSTRNGWQRWNYICLNTWFFLRSCCILSDFERF